MDCERRTWKNEKLFSRCAIRDIAPLRLVDTQWDKDIIQSVTQATRKKKSSKFFSQKSNLWPPSHRSDALPLSYGRLVWAFDQCAGGHNSELFFPSSLWYTCVSYQTVFVVDYSSSKSVVGGPPLVTNDVVQDLKQNIYKLEEEVSHLLQLVLLYFPLVLVCVYLQQLWFF